MVERLLVKEYLSFEEAELFFKPSLVVFTGPSGAGKSILINALLALFGITQPQAALSEMDLDVDWDLDEYGFECEEGVTIRAVKKQKVRYFLNDQRISKKLLGNLTQHYVSYLHQRENSFFQSDKVLELIESRIEDPNYKKILASYQELFKKLGKMREELQELRAKERQKEELKEFLEFEIQKIERINPKEGEYEELLELKKRLSKKEKTLQLLKKAQGIFEYESAVVEVLELLGKESDFFQAAMSELREIFYSEEGKLEELEELDIEGILERLEELSALKRRYGSVEEALRIKEEKKQELERILHSELEEKRLLEEIAKIEQKVEELAQKLSAYRKEAAKELQDDINSVLPSLKLPEVVIDLESGALHLKGSDKVVVLLQGVSFENLSSGEYNRLRLAFLAAAKKGEGVLIVDEIDANISGEESMAVAKILKKLAKRYQIFAISHQAQLASLADQHFLVTKESGKSRVKELKPNERVGEIARIISGEKITQEAYSFAKKLLKEAS